MKIRLKPIAAALATAGVLVAGLAAYEPSRAGILGMFEQKNAVAAATTTTPFATQQNAATSATAKLQPLQAPNYRAIVERWGPAVVGVTVEGTRHVSNDEMADNDDPFFQFFRGMPGFQNRIPRGGDMPFRGQGSGFIIRDRKSTRLNSSH